MSLYVVTTASALVMSKPTNSSTVLGILLKETIIDVLSINKGWAYLEYNNSYGYIKSSNLKLIKPGSVTILYIDDVSKEEIYSSKIINNYNSAKILE